MHVIKVYHWSVPLRNNAEVYVLVVTVAGNKAFSFVLSFNRTTEKVNLVQRLYCLGNRGPERWLDVPPNARTGWGMNVTWLNRLFLQTDSVELSRWQSSDRISLFTWYFYFYATRRNAPPHPAFFVVIAGYKILLQSTFAWKNLFSAISNSPLITDNCLSLYLVIIIWQWY